MLVYMQHRHSTHTHKHTHTQVNSMKLLVTFDIWNNYRISHIRICHRIKRQLIRVRVAEAVHFVTSATVGVFIDLQ